MFDEIVPSRGDFRFFLCRAVFWGVLGHMVTFCNLSRALEIFDIRPPATPVPDQIEALDLGG